MKKLLLLPVVLFGVVAFSVPVFASTIASQTDHSVAGSVNQSSLTQSIGSFTPQGANLDKVSFYIGWSGVGSSAGITIKVSCYQTTAYSVSVDCVSGSTTFSSGGNTATSSSFSLGATSATIYTTSHLTSLGRDVPIASSTMAYLIDVESGGSANLTGYGSSSNTYANGAAISGAGSVADYAFTVTDDYTPTTNNSTDTRIEWVSPPVTTPSATTTSSTFPIHFKYYLNSSNSDEHTFKHILVQLFPLSYPNDPVQNIDAVASTTYDSLQDVTVTVSTPRNGFYLGIISAWNGVTDTVTCQWWDILCKPTNAIVGVSASNKFNVATDTIAADVAPIFLPPEQAAQYCLNSSGAVSVAICQAGVALFIPPTSALTGFNSSVTLLESKFPFSWFYGVYDVSQAINPSSNTATTTPFVSIDFASANIGSTTPFAGILPKVDLFSTTTVQKYFPANVAQPFKFLISITLYSSLAYSAYRTIPALFASSI